MIKINEMIEKLLANDVRHTSLASDPTRINIRTLKVYVGKKVICSIRNLHANTTGNHFPYDVTINILSTQEEFDICNKYILPYLYRKLTLEKCNHLDSLDPLDPDSIKIKVSTPQAYVHMMPPIHLKFIVEDSAKTELPVTKTKFNKIIVSALANKKVTQMIEVSDGKNLADQLFLSTPEA